MITRKRFQTIALILVVVFVFIEGLFFIKLFPKYQIPDEEQYILNVLSFDSGSVPYFVTRSSTGHPVLYEAIIYPLYKGLSFNYFYYAARFTSLLFFVLTLVIAFFISKMLFPSSNRLPVLVISAIALSPQLTFFFSSLNSDSLLMLLSSLVIFLLIRIDLKKSSIADLIFLPLVVVAGFLTKERFVVTLPFIGYIIFLVVARKYKREKQEPKKLGAPLLMILLVPLLAYLGLDYFKQELGLAFDATIFSLSGIFKIFMQFWWGYFGLLQYPWPLGLYLFFSLLLIVAAIGLVLFLKDDKANILQRRWLILFVIVVLIVTMFVVFYHLKTGRGQGRHIFIAVVPFYILLAVGLDTLAQRFNLQRVVLPAFLGFILSVNIYSLVWKTGWLIG